jgi:hypothetical protein
MTPKKMEQKIGKALKLTEEVYEYIRTKEPPINGISDKESMVKKLFNALSNFESFIEELEL